MTRPLSVAKSFVSGLKFDGRRRRRSASKRPRGLCLENLEPRQVMSITLASLANYESGIFNLAAAEGVGYNVAAQRVFVANQSPLGITQPPAPPDPLPPPDGRIDVLDASNIATNPVLPVLGTLDVSSYGPPTSIASFGNLVAVAIPNGTDETLPGVVAFFDAAQTSGDPLKVITVGPVPDHVVFTPDGTKVLTANEGQDSPDADPDGSVSIIDLSQGLANATERKATFTSFNGRPDYLRAQGVRFLEDRLPSQSMEPEYIAVHPNSSVAWVTLQENNAIAQVNLNTGRINWVKGLGFKDHSQPGFGLDPSDRDGGIHIGNWPVFGMYNPDGITTFTSGDQLYLATANEGDGFGGELARVSTLDLDDATFPNEAALKTNAQLGRLNVSQTFGNTDGDADIDRLLTVGARSFSVWTPGVDQVFDSGDDIEQITAAAYPANFNASNTVNTFEDRSDDRGPEPTTIVVGEVAGTKYGFVTVERTGGIMVWDMTNPSAPTFVQYINTRDFSETPGPGTGGDLHPENLIFVTAADSPSGNPLLIVSYQVSGSIQIFEMTPAAAAPSAIVATATSQAVHTSSQRTLRVEEVRLAARRVPTEARATSADRAAATDAAMTSASSLGSLRHRRGAGQRAAGASARASAVDILATDLS